MAVALATLTLIIRGAEGSAVSGAIVPSASSHGTPALPGPLSSLFPGCDLPHAPGTPDRPLAYTSISSRGEVVSRSDPLSVTSTSSSMRTPPHPSM